MTKQLTEQEREDIAAKIDSEGFDYYFTSYGADQKLEGILGKEIKAYQDAGVALRDALVGLGIETE